MKITILCVGSIKEKFFKDAISEYSKRLSRYCKLEIIEVPDEKTPDNASAKEEETILLKEAEKLEKKIPSNAYLIGLAIEGKKYNSLELADKIASLGVNGEGHLVFIIGGSLGIYSLLKKKCDLLISFSDMTFPHQLMRVILLEQIYRTFRINNNEPYHK